MGWKLRSLLKNGEITLASIVNCHPESLRMTVIRLDNDFLESSVA